MIGQDSPEATANWSPLYDCLSSGETNEATGHLDVINSLTAASQIVIVKSLLNDDPVIEFIRASDVDKPSKSRGETISYDDIEEEYSRLSEEAKVKTVTAAFASEEFQPFTIEDEATMRNEALIRLAVQKALHTEFKIMSNEASTRKFSRSGERFLSASYDVESILENLNQPIYMTSEFKYPRANSTITIDHFFETSHNVLYTRGLIKEGMPKERFDRIKKLIGSMATIESGAVTVDIPTKYKEIGYSNLPTPEARFCIRVNPLFRSEELNTQSLVEQMIDAIASGNNIDNIDLVIRQMDKNEYDGFVDDAILTYFKFADALVPATEPAKILTLLEGLKEKRGLEAREGIVELMDRLVLRERPITDHSLYVIKDFTAYRNRPAIADTEDNVSALKRLGDFVATLIDTIYTFYKDPSWSSDSFDSTPS